MRVPRRFGCWASPGASPGSTQPTKTCSCRLPLSAAKPNVARRVGLAAGACVQATVAMQAAVASTLAPASDEPAASLMMGYPGAVGRLPEQVRDQPNLRSLAPVDWR